MWLLFGVYEMAVWIEDPFQGTLRLSIMCDTIRRDVLADERIRSTAFQLEEPSLQQNTNNRKAVPLLDEQELDDLSSALQKELVTSLSSSSSSGCNLPPPSNNGGGQGASSENNSPVVKNLQETKREVMSSTNTPTSPLSELQGYQGSSLSPFSSRGSGSSCDEMADSLFPKRHPQVNGRQRQDIDSPCTKFALLAKYVSLVFPSSIHRCRRRQGSSSKAAATTLEPSRVA
jgi:hypothetical protein